ncbi:MAG: M67 family metallopeptidase [Porphyrobacter sp.]|jgi:proteasome lid subunit RPN8/RPN11|nr:M67 family metallopeptidase [Porphyrobacter sp.]
MDIVLTSEVHAAMLAAAWAAHPHEACGILLGTGARILEARPATNVHAAPATHFEIDPATLIAVHRGARAPGGLQVLGYYHSHPSGLPEPSATDRAMAAHDGRIWAIIAGEEVRLWRDGDDGFAPLFFSLIEG